MKYRDTRLGDTFEVETSKELVQQLHASSRAPAKDDESFMEQMAKRIWQTSGREVHVSSPEDFVNDLVKIGILEKIETQG